MEKYGEIIECHYCKKEIPRGHECVSGELNGEYIYVCMGCEHLLRARRRDEKRTD